jgi:hypothetical protein
MPQGQSLAAQWERLKKRRCPIHGALMGQTSGWIYPLDDYGYTITKCVRQQCEVRARAYGDADDGPLVLEAPLPPGVHPDLLQPLSAEELAGFDTGSYWDHRFDPGACLKKLMFTLMEEQMCRDLLAWLGKHPQSLWQMLAGFYRVAFPDDAARFLPEALMLEEDEATITSAVTWWMAYGIQRQDTGEERSQTSPAPQAR